MSEELCDECGFGSMRALPDKRRHSVYHDEHFNGVKLRRLALFDIVGQIDDQSVLLVRPDSPRFPRLRAERVSRRAIEEPLSNGGYDKPTFYAESISYLVPEHQSHALILARGGRGVGLLVLERRYRNAHYSWESDESRYSLDEGGRAGVAWTIVHIWLLPALRGQHIASRLISFALYGFNTRAEDIAWLPPFTTGGFTLIRRFAPESFWADDHEPPQGDTFARPFAARL